MFMELNNIRKTFRRKFGDSQTVFSCYSLQLTAYSVSDVYSAYVLLLFNVVFGPKFVFLIQVP